MLSAILLPAGIAGSLGASYKKWDQFDQIEALAQVREMSPPRTVLASTVLEPPNCPRALLEASLTSRLAVECAQVENEGLSADEPGMTLRSGGKGAVGIQCTEGQYVKDKEEVALDEDLSAQREKLQQTIHQRLNEAAELKTEEMWQARVNVYNKQKEKEAAIDAVCKSKAEQAEKCLANTRKKVKEWRESQNVWQVS